MNDRLQDRLFGALGALSALLPFAAIVLGGKARMLTISSSPSHIADVLSKPTASASWAGAYLELIAFGCFIAFAVWACRTLGGGLLGQIAQSFAVAYASISVVSLGVVDALAYRAGKGIPTQVATALITLTESLFVTTWFLAVFFVIALTPLVLASGRRVLGWSGAAVAGLILVTTPLSVDGAAQLAFSLFTVWTLAASISLARGQRAPRSAVAIA